MHKQLNRRQATSKSGIITLHVHPFKAYNTHLKFNINPMVYYINLQRKTETESLWKRQTREAATRVDAICMYNPKMIYVCKSVSLLKNIIN